MNVLYLISFLTTETFIQQLHKKLLYFFSYQFMQSTRLLSNCLMIIMLMTLIPMYSSAISFPENDGDGDIVNTAGNDTTQEIPEPASFDTFMSNRGAKIRGMGRGEAIARGIANGSDGLSSSGPSSPPPPFLDVPGETREGSSLSNDASSRMSTNDFSVQSPFGSKWRENIYFPDVSHAQLNFLITVKSYSKPSNAPYPIFRLVLENPDNSVGRFFYVYINGQLKHTAIFGGTNVVIELDASSLFVEGESYLLTIEVYHGYEGKGWKLKYAEIQYGEISFNAYDDQQNTGTWNYPYYTFESYAYVKDYLDPANLYFTTDLTPNIGASRYAYLYVDGDYIGSRIIGGGTVSWWFSDTAGNYVGKLLRLTVKVYVPCTTCETWTMESWNLENTFSWKSIKYDQTVSIHTDWMPDQTYKDDLIWAAYEMGLALYRAFEGQVIVNQFHFGWDDISNCNGDYRQCTGVGTVNIFLNGIPGDMGIFAKIGRIYADADVPLSYGWSGSDKWRKFNGDFTGSLSQYRMFALSHEFSHLYGILDQNKAGCNPSQYTLMVQPIQYEERVRAIFSHRRTNMPSECFLETPPSGYNDWDTWVGTFPNLYHFETSSAMFPSPTWFYIGYTQG